MNKTWMIVAAVAGVLATAPAQAAGELECRSPGYRYNFCPADTGNNVQLLQQSSRAACNYGRSWGYDARGIWVDNGCAARFRYGHDHHSSHGADGAAAAVVGALIIAALVNSQSHHSSGEHDSGSRDSHDSNVPDWVIGRFAGQDVDNGLQIELAIDRRGRIDGYQGSREFSGQVRGTEAWIGNREYSVVRTRGGIKLVGEGRSGFDLYRN